MQDWRTPVAIFAVLIGVVASADSLVIGGYEKIPRFIKSSPQISSDEPDSASLYVYPNMENVNYNDPLDSCEYQKPGKNAESSFSYPDEIYRDKDKENNHMRRYRSDRESYDGEEILETLKTTDTSVGPSEYETKESDLVASEPPVEDERENIILAKPKEFIKDETSGTELPVKDGKEEDAQETVVIGSPIGTEESAEDASDQQKEKRIEMEKKSGEHNTEQIKENTEAENSGKTRQRRQASTVNSEADPNKQEKNSNPPQNSQSLNTQKENTRIENKNLNSVTTSRDLQQNIKSPQERAGPAASKNELQRQSKGTANPNRETGAMTSMKNQQQKSHSMQRQTKGMPNENKRAGAMGSSGNTQQNNEDSKKENTPTTLKNKLITKTQVEENQNIAPSTFNGDHGYDYDYDDEGCEYYVDKDEEYYVDKDEEYYLDYEGDSESDKCEYDNDTDGEGISQDNVDYNFPERHGEYPLPSYSFYNIFLNPRMICYFGVPVCYYYFIPAYFNQPFFGNNYYPYTNNYAEIWNQNSNEGSQYQYSFDQNSGYIQRNYCPVLDSASENGWWYGQPRNYPYFTDSPQNQPNQTDGKKSKWHVARSVNTHRIDTLHKSHDKNNEKQLHSSQQNYIYNHDTNSLKHDKKKVKRAQGHDYLKFLDPSQRSNEEGHQPSSPGSYKAEKSPTREEDGLQQAPVRQINPVSGSADQQHQQTIEIQSPSGLLEQLPSFTFQLPMYWIFPRPQMKRLLQNYQPQPTNSQPNTNYFSNLLGNRYLALQATLIPRHDSTHRNLDSTMQTMGIRKQPENLANYIYQVNIPASDLSNGASNVPLLENDHGRDFNAIDQSQFSYNNGHNAERRRAKRFIEKKCKSP